MTIEIIVNETVIEAEEGTTEVVEIIEEGPQGPPASTEGLVEGIGVSVIEKVNDFPAVPVTGTLYLKVL